MQKQKANFQSLFHHTTDYPQHYCIYILGSRIRHFLIMLAVPFGVTGGFWWVWLAGYNVSVAVAVGFIALAGIAVETAIVMLIYIDHQMRDHPPATYEALIENIKHGAAQKCGLN